MKRQFTRFDRATGFTLLEMVVALVLGLILMSGVIQLLINSNNAFRMQNNMTNMQENGQFAAQYLANDIRNADYWGCLNTTNWITNNLNGAAASTYYNFANAVAGTANQSTGGSIVAGTDTITLSGSWPASGNNDVIIPYGTTTSSPVAVTATSSIASGTIVLVSDCLAGDIFQVTNDVAGVLSHASGAGSPGNATAVLSKIYTLGSFVYLPYTRMYSIQTDANGVPGLFLTTASGAQELIDNIEDLFILYGEDTDGNGSPDRYVAANQVTNMGHVLAVRLSFVARSAEDNIVTTPQTYILNGQTITPTDNRLRRVYTETISIRNRLQ
ncbi:MAG: PilW family protein [Gammaproteobacteria bacterium]|nr:PilW family protein [Gammaproteobacteria bacterium]